MVCLDIGCINAVKRNYSGLEGLIVVKHGEAGDRSQEPSTPKAWLPSPLDTNALEGNQLTSH
jgi:hypothetical protein